MSKIHELTSNQYYKGLNNRFDKRVRRLLKLKNLYYDSKDATFYNIHTKIFSRRIQSSYGLSTTFIMHADNRAFFDRLYSIERY